VRLRFKYSKTGDAAFLGHLEMLRFWQRAMRRAGLPLAYSSGFNPHPRLAFGPALAVGAESLAEYLDVELTKAVAPEEVKTGLQAEMPAGIKLLLVIPIPTRTRALTAIIDAAAYRVSWLERPDLHLLQQRVKELLDRKVVQVSRPGKEGARAKDIRPGIFNLELGPENALEMLLESSSRGNVRPEQVLKAMDWDEPGYILRTGLFIRRGDALLTPEEVI